MSVEKSKENIYQLLAQTCDQYADKTAITYIESISPEITEQQISYREFFGLINQVARFLHRELGSRRAVVSFMLPNIPQAQTLLWGGEAVAIMDPLNPLLDEESLVGLLDAAQTEIIVALGPQASPGIWEKTLAVVEKAKTVKKVFSVLTRDEQNNPPLFEEEVAREDTARLPDDWLPKLTDIAAYFHTGGTTGVPKLAMHTHKNHLVAAQLRFKYSGLNAGDSQMNCLPLFHVGGSILLSLGMFIGGVNVVLPTIEGLRNPEVISHCWKIVEHYQLTSLACVPTSLAAILQQPVNDNDISSLSVVASGGSVVPDVVSDGVQRLIGKPLYQIYGMTETCGVIALPYPIVTPIKGCAGYIPSEVEIRIGDGTLSDDESGEINIRCDCNFAGFLNHTSNPIDTDGWLASGDIGHVDEQGRLFITGRSKDLIIRSGHNIDPLAIEACLESHPAVNLAAAVGKPDSYAGELPVVYVQLNEGHQVTEDELHAFAMKNVNERPACPKNVFILEVLPVTAVGKIHKPTLREHAAEFVVKEAICQKFPMLTFSLSTEIAKSGITLIDLVTEQLSDDLRRLLEKLQSELKLVITMSNKGNNHEC